MQIRNRIKELRQVKASELLPNPRNWRRHPAGQADALRGALAEIGYADALIAYETPDGLMLIDGHLRAETTPDMEVPVLITDLNEKEANLLLTTLDPLATMATTDHEALTALMTSVNIENENLRMTLDNLLANDMFISDSFDAINKSADNIYIQTTETPIYTPTGPQPNIDELTDRSTTDKLIHEIKQADIPKDIEAFLLDAAERHSVFDYQKIANYYAHAPANIQALMERSALVIIDYERALEYGFVRLVKDIDIAFNEEYQDA